MVRKHYDEASCVRSLSKKNSIHFAQNGTTKYVQILKGSTEVGNGSWGKIDYLCKAHGYYPMFVTQFSANTKKIYNTADDNSEQNNTKAAKRERKLNMATMAKSAMKRVKTK